MQRPISEGLEAILGKRFDVLDHGFIRVVDYMGNQTSIADSARVSYQMGTRKAQDDAKLCRYLMRHRHSSPFEMCEIKFHVKLPIFVARQWIRHRTANVNEMSARYSILEAEFYTPKEEAIQAQSMDNKQGRSGETPIGADEMAEVLSILKNTSDSCYADYLKLANIDPSGAPLLNGRTGIAREIARANLPISAYTQWYWKIDLRNLIHFLSLRNDPHAQFEIRQYANVMADMVKQWVPEVYEAAEDYVFKAETFSRLDILAIREVVLGNLSINEARCFFGDRREHEEFKVKAYKITQGA